MVNFGFWRTSCRFRGTFGVDLWLLVFSFVFGFDPVLVWSVSNVFCGLRWVFVGFSLVVNINGCGLWVLEKIR